MSTYNLSEIMTAAHKLHKNAKEKYPTFSDALKKAWQIAKFKVMITAKTAELEEQAKASKAEEEAKRAEAKKAAEALLSKIHKDSQPYRRNLTEEAKAAGLSYGEYVSRMSQAMGYGTGRYNGD